MTRDWFLVDPGDPYVRMAQIDALDPPKPRPLEPPSQDPNECPWCFEPLGDTTADFNGATGHLACALHAHHAVLGEGSAPWMPRVIKRRRDVRQHRRRKAS